VLETAYRLQPGAVAGLRQDINLDELTLREGKLAARQMQLLQTDPASAFGEPVRTAHDDSPTGHVAHPAACMRVRMETQGFESGMREDLVQRRGTLFGSCRVHPVISDPHS
jgi:hypothetical protein